MSLPVVDRSEIPADTARLGRELMAEDNLYRQLGDKLANLVKDEDFAWMYSPLGGPGISPVILALVTVLQMMEKLPDRLAAEMVRMRIDWKYALHLPLTWAGFYWTNLSHFRQRLLEHEAEYLVFDKLVQELVEMGFIQQFPLCYRFSQIEVNNGAVESGPKCREMKREGQNDRRGHS